MVDLDRVILLWFYTSMYYSTDYLLKPIYLGRSLERIIIGSGQLQLNFWNLY